MKRFSRIRKIGTDARALWDESALCGEMELTRVHKFAHFWLMVGRSFARNRCPVRASALAYASLLALIPMLAVVVSITSTFLKKTGEERIDQFIEKLVATVTPPSGVGTTSGADTTNAIAAGATSDSTGVETPAAAASAGTNQSALSSLAHADEAVKARKEAAHRIHEFIQNTRSGTLGVTGSVLLIFSAISMLSRIEDTFNDIWGVARGRGWFMRIVLYWGVISLAPMLVIVATGLAGGAHLGGASKLLTAVPILHSVVFQVAPVVLLCLAFAAFYMLMPNTRVRWQAALAGGLVGGGLFHLNNALSVLYVSRVVSASKIYGSLGLVPVFMIGLYFAWLILLFGAQVAYAYQNRASYVEEKQLEQINQRGREFVALRMLTCIGQRFRRGDPAPGVVEMGKELGVPTRLLQQLAQTLCAARLLVEAAGSEAGYLPARPLETITCHDVLLALRAGQGQELATRNEPARDTVYGEFQRIQDAEQQAASSVTLLALVNRAEQKKLESVGASERGSVGASPHAGTL
jgi:membrane protein